MMYISVREFATLALEYEAAWASEHQVFNELVAPRPSALQAALQKLANNGAHQMPSSWDLPVRASLTCENCGAGTDRTFTVSCTNCDQNIRVCAACVNANPKHDECVV